MSTIIRRPSFSFLDAFVAPGEFFANFERIRRFGPWVLTALLLLIASSYQLFYASMEESRILEQQLEKISHLSLSEQEAARDALEGNVGSTGMVVGTLVAIGHLVQVTALATFYLLGSWLMKFRSNQFSFNQWFNLVVWCQLPWFINYIVFVVLFLTSSSADLPLSLPQFAAIGQVFFSGLESTAYEQWAQSLNLFYLWVIFMLASALRRCFSISAPMAVLLAALPYVLVFGVWFVAI